MSHDCSNAQYVISKVVRLNRLNSRIRWENEWDRKSLWSLYRWENLLNYCRLIFCIFRFLFHLFQRKSWSYKINNTRDWLVFPASIINWYFVFWEYYKLCDDANWTSFQYWFDPLSKCLWRHLSRSSSWKTSKSFNESENDIRQSETRRTFNALKK